MSVIIKKQISKIGLVVLTLFALSCADSKYTENIVGEWSCISWTASNLSTNKCKNNVYFKFNEEKNYWSKIGSVADSGTFKILEKKLRFQPANKLEVVVGIEALNGDTLRLLMNQGGTEELLVLTRK